MGVCIGGLSYNSFQNIDTYKVADILCTYYKQKLDYLNTNDMRVWPAVILLEITYTKLISDRVSKY